ncbi:uncharacterized protein DFE_0163 [Desulfovibrio ferrophilus]|uniref:Uncharacterized protein n=1 Tax=Desulfovibrio ferrophilus TaxID=241368 RepID=A0A2Z6AUI1_9BACT|nr:uncharacterized protein DFE_0163 [Desulfovibrio ferrophilus]
MFILLAALVQPAPAVAAENIVMLFSGGYPPYYDFPSADDTNSNKPGFFTEFLAAFKRAHPEFSIIKTRLPRKRIDHWMREGRAQAFSLNSELFIKEEDRHLFEFSIPLCRSCDHLATRADAQFHYSGPDSLKGHLLGIVHGNGYGPLDPLIESGQIATAAPQGEQRLVKMLMLGHVNLAILNRETGRTAMERQGVAPGDIKFLDPPIYCFDLAVQVRKEHQAFLQSLNAFIKTSQTNGFMEYLRAKWLRIQ